MLDFLKLVQELRIFEKKYQRTKSGGDMIHRNELAAQVDAQIEGLIREHTKKKFERPKPSDEVMDIFDRILWDDDLNHAQVRVDKKNLVRMLSQIGIDIDAYHKSKGR